MEWLLTREVIVSLAVLGALPSVAASVLEARGGISPARARQLNLVGYCVMGISMLLFIIVGFRSY